MNNENDKEWRRLIFKKLDSIEEKVNDIDKEMTTLKVKVAIFSSIAGAVVSFIGQKLFGIQGG